METERDSAGSAPKHYSGIRAYPHSARGWVLHIFAAGVLQTFALAIFSHMAGGFLFLIVPVLAMVDPIFYTYLGILFGFVIGSALAGNLFPHYAFYRSGTAFFLIALYDYFRIAHWNQTGIFVQEAYSLGSVIPFAVLGALICAFAGSLGSRWNRGIGEWLQEEIDEFWDSVGVENESPSEEDGADRHAVSSPDATAAPDS